MERLPLDGAKLRAARLARGLSQEGLAELAGCTQRTVSRAETGEAVPHPANVRDLAAVLGVSIAELCSEDSTGGSRRSLGIGTLPPLPRNVIGREQDMQQLRRRLIQREGAGPPLATIYGWPGVGKTTLASCLAHDAELQRRFSDGVLWCSLGRQADMRVVVAGWCRAAGLDAPELASLAPAEMSSRLAHVLHSRRVLLVVDDAWSAADVQLLRVGSTHSALLVTTRITALADALTDAGETYRLGVLDAVTSVELLRSIVPEIAADHERACARLAASVEGLPLALQVAGKLLRAEQRRGFTVAELVEALAKDAARIHAAAVPADLESGAARTVAALFARSTDALDPLSRARFAALGAFVPRPAIFTLEAVEAVWGLDGDPQARSTLAELVDRGLVETLGTGRYQMHALLAFHAEQLLRSAPVTLS